MVWDHSSTPAAWSFLIVVAQRRPADRVALSRLLGEARAHVTGKVAAVGFIQGFVNSFAKEVPITAADYPLRGFSIIGPPI